MFVDPWAIVPATGEVTTAGAERLRPLSTSGIQRSDLRLASKQADFNVNPVTANAMLHWDATYAFLDIRETFTGFTSTAGNPFDAERGPHFSQDGIR